jgi:hypothetical protein
MNCFSCLHHLTRHSKESYAVRSLAHLTNAETWDASPVLCCLTDGRTVSVPSVLFSEQCSHAIISKRTRLGKNCALLGLRIWTHYGWRTVKREVICTHYGWRTVKKEVIWTHYRRRTVQERGNLNNSHSSQELENNARGAANISRG